MKESVTNYQLMISCPSDIKAELDSIEQVCSDFNLTFGRLHQIRIDVLYWKNSIYPQFGESPQDIINHQLADESDLLIALFNSRLGTPTNRNASGTVEEIYRIVHSGKNAFVYFSQIPYPLDEVDLKQLGALRDFKKKLQKECLYAEYHTIEEFRQLFSQHLTLYFTGVLKKKS